MFLILFGWIMLSIIVICNIFNFCIVGVLFWVRLIMIIIFMFWWVYRVAVNLWSLVKWCINFMSCFLMAIFFIYGVISKKWCLVNYWMTTIVNCGCRCWTTSCLLCSVLIKCHWLFVLYWKNIIAICCVKVIWIFFLFIWKAILMWLKVVWKCVKVIFLKFKCWWCSLKRCRSWVWMKSMYWWWISINRWKVLW